MDMIRKLVPVEVRELGDHQLEIAGSTEDVDRMGDIIKAKGWLLAPFKKNPVFMWGHDYNQPPIGRALKVWVDKETKRLMFIIEFADAETYAFADTIYKLYKGGFLHATSVGFIPLNWEGKSDENPYPKWEGNVFTSQELLELSAVPVPANANALVTARDQGLITVKEFEAVTWQPDSGIIVPPKELILHTGEVIIPLKDFISKPEETEDFLRIPVADQRAVDHSDCKIETIDVDKDKGIKSLYCVDDKVIKTYLFAKDHDEMWTMTSAQAWVYEHAKSFTLVDITARGDKEPHFAITAPLPGLEVPKPQARTVTQAQLRDDIDFVHRAIVTAGLNEETEILALDLASEIIMRSLGNDIPVEILEKVGAVLNAKNKGRLTQIQELAQAVLDSAVTADEGEKQLETLTDAELIKQRAREVAEVAKLVIAQLKGKRI